MLPLKGNCAKKYTYENDDVTFDRPDAKTSVVAFSLDQLGSLFLDLVTHFFKSSNITSITSCGNWSPTRCLTNVAIQTCVGWDMLHEFSFMHYFTFWTWLISGIHRVFHLKDLSFSTCLDGHIGWASDFKSVMAAVGSSIPTGSSFLVNLFFHNLFALPDFLSYWLIVKNQIAYQPTMSNSSFLDILSN